MSKIIIGKFENATNINNIASDNICSHFLGVY